MKQNIAIALFKGKSWTSKLIKWFTWSEYSHVAIIFTDDLVCYESWDGVGVIVNPVRDLQKVHQPGTPVDLYRFNVPIDDNECARMREYAISQLGKKYDYAAIFGFLFRKKWASENKLFCSEYVSEILEAGGRKIVLKADYKIPPQAFAETIALEKYSSFVI